MVVAGGTGVSPDYDTTQYTHTQKITKRRGDAKRTRNGGFGVSAKQGALKGPRTVLSQSQVVDWPNLYLYNSDLKS